MILIVTVEFSTHTQYPTTAIAEAVFLLSSRFKLSSQRGVIWVKDSIKLGFPEGAMNVTYIPLLSLQVGYKWFNTQAFLNRKEIPPFCLFHVLFFCQPPNFWSFSVVSCSSSRCCCIKMRTKRCHLTGVVWSCEVGCGWCFPTIAWMAYLKAKLMCVRVWDLGWFAFQLCGTQLCG